MSTIALSGQPVSAPRLFPGWPTALLFAALPLWWALGIASFVWLLVALPLLAALLLRERAVIPRRFGIWLLFLGWMLASAVQLESETQVIAFIYRAALYLSATVVFLYVFTSRREQLPTRVVVNALTALWALVVACGYLGLVFPDGSFRSPMELLLPEELLQIQFVYDIVHPAFAQPSTFLGYDLPRPKAPFPYTNAWGANFALLLPFVFVTLKSARSPLTKRVLGGLLALSIPPVVFTLDRGVWLSLTIASVYAAVYLAGRGNMRALTGLAALVGVVAGLLFVTPLGGLIGDRLAHGHSDENRQTLYQESLKGAADSPLVGFGAPRPSETNPNLPSVGTHGQSFLVLFSHGVPALVFFIGWFAYVLHRCRRGSSAVGSWAHVVLLIFLVQTLYYDLMPVGLHIAMVAAALALRDLTPRPEQLPPSPSDPPAHPIHDFARTKAQPAV